MTPAHPILFQKWKVLWEHVNNIQDYNVRMFLTTKNAVGL